MVRWICALLIGSLFLVGSSQADQLVPKRLLHAMENIGVHPTSYVVHHSGRTSERLTPSQVAENVRQWVNELSLSHLEKSVDADGIRYDASGKWGKGLAVSFYLIIDHPDAGTSQPYMALQVTSRGQQKNDWWGAADRIQGFLNKRGIPAHLHYSIQGNINEHSANISGTAQRVMRHLKAKEIEGMATNQTVSISAYSPVLSDTIQTRGGAMNLQVATHRDERTGKLIVTIGSPIITIEY
jgi:hypothetical protein